MSSTAVVWFRQDLRLHDNKALAMALDAGDCVVPLFIWAPEEEASWEPGSASSWWLHHALADLQAQFKEHGVRLLLRQTSKGCSSADILKEVAKATKAETIYWNRRYEPAVIGRDTRIKASLQADGFQVTSANSGMLFEPHEIANKAGKPFRVFTPMWRHYSTLDVPEPIEVDLKQLQSRVRLPKGDKLNDFNLLPQIGWAGDFGEFWGKPTRASMLERLDGFIAKKAENYMPNRDFPEVDGTTRLSPFLHFGQIGPRELWARFASANNRSVAFDDGVMRQVIWREFAHHLLFHFPETTSEPLNPKFANFPWENTETFLRAWQKGETGYPIVDAGMRQLWQTGWMHNRVRMIVGSLLVKHLLQHWHEGARWFWDTLVDADLANNTMGWQWIGGCGADAAPYFRIFNPIAQGEKFDKTGAYVRRYVPELAKVPAKYIHQPWELGELELSGCGVVLGRDYPAPIIPHRDGREQALAAFKQMNEQT
jgi:deoxyribodipyrimidine photo-lyase